jgi:ABC-type branched-subunit amino acid transport system substrate-binding protein
LTAGIAVAVVVAVLVAWLLPVSRWSPFYPCSAGLRAESGSCIGVSDSSDFGDPLLASVMSRIAAENAAVDGPYYTVGFLLPLQPESDRTAESSELRRELAGAHVAQLRANHTAEIEGGGPKIKLVVGNAGTGNAHWPEIVERFRQMADGSERLRAVAGMGYSLATTQRAIAALTRPEGGEPIAVVGSRLTADSLSLDPASRLVDGFVRVAPTNTDEARAAAEHIRRRGYTRPLLLRDTNARDPYAATLATAFRNAYGQTAEATFDSGKDGLGAAFSEIARNLCVERPDVVYFAGRGEPLAQFVDVLANRQCQEIPLDIVTGDDTSGIRDLALAGDVGVRTALSGNVTLVYTGLAHPGMWDVPELRDRYNAGALAYFREGCDSCFHTLFPDESVDDGTAIMGHDTVLLAVTAIRRAGQTTDAEAQDVSTGAVIQMLYQIRGINDVAGASGELSLSACGDAVGKLFPLLSLEVDGSTRLVEPAAAGEPLAC